MRTSEDFLELARRRTPRSVCDYVEGGAEREVALTRATKAFERLEFQPSVLRDVSNLDPSTTVLGRSVAFPAILGPTGFTRMMRTEGEPAVARPAGRAGVPYVLSMVGTTSTERLAREAPDTDRWFQLYMLRDRARSRDQLQRAAAHGVQTLVLTVDVPVAGARLRDVANGLTIPPSLSAKTVVDMARHPRWAFDMLSTPLLSFESLGAADDLVSQINAVFDPACTFDELAWVRSEWHGDLVVKGVQRVQDAQAAVEAGADAVVVSAHGGRQLDRVAAPLDLLEPVVDAVGTQVEVYLDGGVRSGADVAAAVALGARAAFVARPYLYALMAAGESGVDRLLHLLREDYVRTLQLLGVRRTAEIQRDAVRLLPR